MKIAIISIGSFDEQYSDYHLIKDIILGLLNRNHYIWLIQKKYNNVLIYPDVFDEYINAGRLNIVNIAFEKKNHRDLKARYFSDINYYLRACRKLKIIIPDVIYLQSNNTAFLPVFYAKRILKKPLLYNEQDIFPDNARITGILNRSSFVYRLAHVAQKYTYKNATALSTISEDMRNTIAEEYKIEKSRIEVIYNWGHEQTEQSIAYSDKTNQFLLKFPKNENEFRVMYAGNLGKMQNVELILKTSELLKNYKKIKFYIVGSGSNECSLKKYASDKKLDNVKFVGMQPPEMAGDVYSSADINIIPLQKGLIFASLPSKTADCLLARKPIIFCIDKNSVFANLIEQYRIDNATVDNPEKLKNMIIEIENGRWNGEPQAFWKSCFSKKENVELFCESIERLQQ